MLKVTIDSVEQQISSPRTMSELVELVQATIDPEKIIVSMTLNGKDLSEVDWRTPLSVHTESVIAFETGSRDDYLSDRFLQSPELLQHIIFEFNNVRESFQKSSREDANRLLSTAVDDLRAFIEWYNSLLFIATSVSDESRSEFVNNIESLTKICETLLQQHLYQSWWALGETIESKLEPQLQSLLANVSRVSETATHC